MSFQGLITNQIVFFQKVYVFINKLTMWKKTRVFRKTAQFLIRPQAFVLGRRLYGVNMIIFKGARALMCFSTHANVLNNRKNALTKGIAKSYSTNKYWIS